MGHGKRDDGVPNAMNIDEVVSGIESRLAQGAKRLQAFDADQRAGVLAECGRLAGPMAEIMAASYTETWQQLRNPDPHVRRAALKLLVLYWERKPELGPRCEELAFDDPDPKIRESAMIFLGGCYRGSWHVRLGRRLAKAVLDASAPLEWRQAAYRGLFSIRGMSSLELVGKRFPEDVDWDFVHSFFVDREPPTEAEKLYTRFPFLGFAFCAEQTARDQAKSDMSKRNFEGAVAHLTEAIQAEPVFTTYMERGIASMEWGRLDEAIADFTEALRQCPNARGYSLRAQAYDAKGLERKARRDREAAGQMNPQGPAGGDKPQRS